MLGHTSSDVECFKKVRSKMPSANAASQDSEGHCFAEYDAHSEVDHSSNQHYRTCYFTDDIASNGNLKYQNSHSIPLKIIL